MKLSHSVTIFTRIAQQINAFEFQSKIQVNNREEKKDNKSKQCPEFGKSCTKRTRFIEARSLALEITTEGLDILINIINT